MSNLETSISKKTIDIPNEYLCPITHQIFYNPYKTKYGHIFEKSAIKAWLSENKSCPLTRQSLNLHTDILPADKEFKDKLQLFIQDNKLEDYVFKTGCIDNIISFIEEYNNLLSKSNDINELYYIKEEFKINRSDIKSISYQYSIINELNKTNLSEITQKYDIINYYIDVIVELCDFKIKLFGHIINIAKDIISNIHSYIKLFNKIYKNIIKYYNKLINNYDTINLLIPKEILYLKRDKIIRYCKRVKSMLE
jgi:hypothetical protein